LTDEYVETLEHLFDQRMGDNTLRAPTSGLAYLEACGLAASSKFLPWPAPEATLLKFVAHHLWDPEKRACDPSHGMTDDVEENLRRQSFLKSVGPHAPDTLRRRLTNWSILPNNVVLSGAFASPVLKQAIRLAFRPVPRKRRRKSAKAVTGDILATLLAIGALDRLRHIRDRAILMVAFASWRPPAQRDCRASCRAVEARGTHRDTGQPSPPLVFHPSRPHQNGPPANRTRMSISLVGRWKR